MRSKLVAAKDLPPRFLIASSGPERVRTLFAIRMGDGRVLVGLPGCSVLLGPEQRVRVERGGAR